MLIKCDVMYIKHHTKRDNYIESIFLKKYYYFIPDLTRKFYKYINTL